MNGSTGEAHPAGSLHLDLNLVDVGAGARFRGDPPQQERRLSYANLNESGALLPGRGAILAGPTFEEWVKTDRS